MRATSNIFNSDVWMPSPDAGLHVVGRIGNSHSPVCPSFPYSFGMRVLSLSCSFWIPARGVAARVVPNLRTLVGGNCGKSTDPVRRAGPHSLFSGWRVRPPPFARYLPSELDGPIGKKCRPRCRGKNEEEVGDRQLERSSFVTRPSAADGRGYDNDRSERHRWVRLSLPR
jgi:hypothetical protein